MSAGQSPHGIGPSVGARIRAARQAKKYTQSQLAAPHFSVSYISAIERGHIHPSLRALELIAQRLGITSADLFPGRPRGTPGDETSANATNATALTLDEQFVEVTLLEAQGLILQGNNLSSMRLLEGLTVQNVPQQYLARLHYLLGWVYFQAGQRYLCEGTLSEAEGLAQKQDDTYALLRIRDLLGMTHAAMHRHRQALSMHQACLKQAELMPVSDPFFQCHLYNQLGQHYTHLNDFVSALEMFEQALAMANNLANPSYLAETYTALFQHYIETQEYYLASLYAHKCMYLARRREEATLKGEIYYALSQAAMKSQPERALAYLQQALQQEGEAHDLFSQASISLCLGEWLLEQDMLEEARTIALQASEFAQSFGATVITAEIVFLRGRIDYAQGRYDEGDRHLEDGLEMFAALEKHDIFSDRAALYAQLLAEFGRSEEAYNYYKLAFESQQRKAPPKKGKNRT